MRNIILAAVLALVGGMGAVEKAHADSTSFVVEQLPMSNNDTGDGIYKSTAVTPANVTVSSSVLTQLDSTLNTQLSAILGATYRRYSVDFQNVTSSNIYVGYDPVGLSTATAGDKIGPGERWSYKVGKAIHLYGLTDAAGSTGVPLRVGGSGWKQ